MNHPRKEDQLEVLYRRIPEINCRGLCQDCCGTFIISRLERSRIVKACGLGIAWSLCLWVARSGQKIDSSCGGPHYDSQ